MPVCNNTCGLTVLFKCYYMCITFFITFARICNNMKKLLLTIVLTGMAITADAQGHLEAGLSLGAASGFDDINYSSYMYSPSFSAGVTGRYVMNNRSSLRLSLDYSGHKGDDADFGREWRNHSFNSDIYSAGFVYEFNFLPFSQDYVRNRYLGGSAEHRTYPFSPYLFLGAGYAFGNVNYTVADNSYKEDISGFLYIPFGTGIRFRLNSTMNASVEAGFHKATTDKADGLKTPGKSHTFRNTEWFSYISASVLVKIPGSQRLCAAFGKNSSKDKKAKHKYVFD